ncbi:hypothetical protein ACHAXR_005160 [Thalassiosira sp. AJA248-18]
MTQFATFLTLLFLAPAFGFLTQAPPRPNSACYAKKKGRQTNVPKPLPTGPPAQDISLPDDCTMEEMLAVMGETRLKKVARKNRRARNQKIREGKVVLNEKGEWIPRE